MSDLAKASSAFFKWIIRGSADRDFTLTPEFIAEVEALREEIRAENNGGGMCHLVTEALQAKYGWERLYVTYMTESGEIICGGGHVINVLPDGSVLDPTRDQFGEGFSVSLIENDSEEIGRYRPEFYSDYHPGHPDIRDGELDAWLPYFTGQEDSDIGQELSDTRGRGWWLEDTSLYDAYLQKQKQYGLVSYRM